MIKLNALDLKKVIKETSPTIAGELGKAASSAANEAQFAKTANRILERFAESIGLELYALVEHTVATGRIDALYNRLVIEYERPKTLTDSNKSAKNAEAIGQVKRYITGLVEKEKRAGHRFAGVATDGFYFIFARYIEGRFRIDNPVKVTPRTTERLLEYLAALTLEKPLTADNLIRDFGIGSDIATATVPRLYEMATGEMEARAEVIFGQWAENFSEACDYEKGIAHAKRTVLQKAAGMFSIPDKTPRPLPLFFSIHTYFAIIVKLLALRMATVQRFKRQSRDLLREMAEHGPDSLLARLTEVESGEMFDKLGIKNFLEADFFSWYLGNWNGGLAENLGDLVASVYRYDMPSAETQPDEYRDILKEIYQDLMPRELRHNLGEYYTPDWLVERILNQLGYDGDPNLRILDPACGSGTFLYHEVSRVRRKGLDEYADERGLLRKVLSNVVGFDLNPVAVITARTSYLLALGDLLDYQDEDIFLPVYTADSIMTPHQGKALTVSGAMVVETTVGEFRIPESLTNLQDLHRFTEDISLHVRNELPVERFVEKCVENYPNLLPDERSHVKFTYERILDLEKQGKNRIWGAIIKNMFAPIFVRQFDLIAGNPPWINWEHLPEKYRRKTFDLWQNYELFPHKGYDKILGHAKDDISTLMTYVAIDKYLKKGGKLGFVISQSVFKTGKAGMGFRRLQMGDGEYIKVITVDDMVELKPFPGVANRTAVMILQKGKKTRYPVPYEYWKKKKRVSLKPEMTLEEVTPLTKRLHFHARPVADDDLTSAWITGRKNALVAVSKVLGKSDYRAREGLNTGGANAVFWVNIIDERSDGLIIVRNITKGAQRKVPEVETIVEPDLVYPLLRGRDVKRWLANPSAHVITTHLEGEGLNAIPEDVMKDRYPHTYTYLKNVENTLRERSVYGRYFKDTAPFYSMFNIGDYTFARWKVVWREVATTIIPSVVSKLEDKTIIPDHKNILVDFENDMEAYYVGSVVGSSPFNFCVTSNITISPSPRLLNNLYIPTYSTKKDEHNSIAELSITAHELATSGDDAKLADLEAELDERVAHLYGITDKELKEIQRSLKELLE